MARHEWTQEEKHTATRFRQWVESEGLTQGEAARLIGCKRNIMSAMLNCNYKGLVPDLLRLMRAAMARGSLRREAPNAPPYVTTSISERVIDTLTLAHVERCLCLVLGPSGIGKSSAARAYCRENPSAVHIVLGPRSSAWPTLRRVGAAIGYAMPNNIAATGLRDMLIVALRGSDRLLVLDECDPMPEETMQSLRIVGEEAGVGVAMIGTEAYQNKLRDKNSPTINQFLNRVAHAEFLTGISADDVRAIAAPFNLDDASLTCLAKAAGGEARTLAHILCAAQRRSKDQITLQAVRRAVAALPAPRLNGG